MLYVQAYAHTSVLRKKRRWFLLNRVRIFNEFVATTNSLILAPKLERSRNNIISTLKIELIKIFENLTIEEYVQQSDERTLMACEMVSIKSKFIKQLCRKCRYLLHIYSNCIITP